MIEDNALEIPLREDDLRNPVEGLFPERKYFTKREVPFGLKRIDLVFKSKGYGRDIIAVELKLRDWKRAIWQAVHNRQVAKRSYIAVPEATADHIDKGVLRSLGLGLIVANIKNARILIPARKSQYVNRRLSQEVSLIVERKICV